jgi:PAS domain S-box-containing protein
MKAAAAGTDTPEIPSAAVDFYAQMVREFPWGMFVLHLRDPERTSTWRQVAANSRAKRLLGSDFTERLKLPISSEGELADRPIDIAAAIRYVLEQRRARPLGHVTGGAKNQPPEIYAVHALPLEQNCVAVVLYDVSKDVRARRDQTGAKARLNQICRSARAILWTADPETLEFTSVTPEARSILGYWVERWSSEPNFWHNHAHPDDWELIQSHCLQTARDGAPTQWDLRMYDVEGKTHWFRVHLSVAEPRTGRAQLSGVMVDITDQKRNEQAARELSAQVMRAQEQERKRISRDLHDSVGQYLTGLHWSLSRIVRNESSDEKLREELKECAQMVRVCMDEVRAVSYALHPPAIDMLGLAPALEWQAKRFAEQSALQIHLDIPERIHRTDADREIALFRVFQECLSNVRRHAKTDTAHARLRTDEQSIILEVEDSGVGVPPDVFDNPGRKGRGIGLLKMRERLAELGGTLEIISNEPGTTVRARVPHGRRAESASGERESTRQVGSARRKSARR